MVLGYVQILPSWMWLVLVVPLTIFGSMMKGLERSVLVLGIVLIWVSHAIQVFVPETGFDAVWYHLPVMKSAIQNNGFVYMPDMYQSVNPLFTDGIILLGYQVGFDFGAKFVAYLLGVSLAIVTYSLARMFMQKSWAYIATILVSLVQVVAWQSASFYIDVGKALWEIGVLYVLFQYVWQKKDELNQWHYVLLGLLIGATLGTKLFSVLLLPFFVYALASSGLSNRKSLKILAIGLAVAGPYYLFSFLHTGDAFYGITYGINILGEIGNESNTVSYLFQRMVSLPVSLAKIVLARDYINPLLMLTGLPILLFTIKSRIQDSRQKLMLVFVVFQWLIWWFVPPLSTRYALSGFIVLVLLIVLSFREVFMNNSRSRNIILAVIFLASIGAFIPRLVVNYRSMKFILGSQTKQEYIEQFYDGTIDDKLKSWQDVK